MHTRRDVILLLCVLALGVNLTDAKEVTEGNEVIESASNNEAETQLYNYIKARNFEKAIELILSLFGRVIEKPIKNTIDRLIDEGDPIIFDLACKLKEAGAKFILRKFMHPSLRISENLTLAKLIDNRYGYAIQFSESVDWYNDRKVLGSQNTTSTPRKVWWFNPVWSDNRLYFTMRTVQYPVFLKLGNSKDWDGDYTAYGSKDFNTDRHLWYLKPVRYNGKLLFYIINKEFDKLLKLGQSTAYDDYRMAYGHSEMDLNPEKFAWNVERV